MKGQVCIKLALKQQWMFATNLPMLVWMHYHPKTGRSMTIQTIETWEGRATGSCAEPGRPGFVFFLYLPGETAQKGGKVAKAISSQSKD